VLASVSGSRDEERRDNDEGEEVCRKVFILVDIVVAQRDDERRQSDGKDVN